jgi:hypothetical protein
MRFELGRKKLKKGTCKASIACAHCHGSARFIRKQSKLVQTLAGTITWERRYYYCSGCKHGFCPDDAQFNLKGNESQALREAVTLAGTQNSFAQAVLALYKLGGIVISESTVERITEASGEELKQRQSAGEYFGETTAWKWTEDREGKRCGYVSIDATGVRMQGKNGNKREGRMAYAGRLYNPPRDRKQPQKSVFAAGLCSLEEIATQLARMAEPIGSEDVDQWIAVIDAGSGIANAIRTQFPFCEVILDFWHAKEYLVELVNELYPTDLAARAKWLSVMCHRLKHQGGARVCWELERLTLVPEATAAAEEVRRKTVRYYTNHEDHMDYPAYLARGWQIGSGPVESACKHVVKERLAGSGMRWSEHGADALCRLRALWNSPSAAWQAFWN